MLGPQDPNLCPQAESWDNCSEGRAGRRLSGVPRPPTTQPGHLGWAEVPLGSSAHVSCLYPSLFLRDSHGIRSNLSRLLTACLLMAHIPPATPAGSTGLWLPPMPLPPHAPHGLASFHLALSSHGPDPTFLPKQQFSPAYEDFIFHGHNVSTICVPSKFYGENATIPLKVHTSPEPWRGRLCWPATGHSAKWSGPQAQQEARQGPRTGLRKKDPDRSGGPARPSTHLGTVSKLQSRAGSAVALRLVPGRRCALVRQTPAPTCCLGPHPDPQCHPAAAYPHMAPSLTC